MHVKISTLAPRFARWARGKQIFHIIIGIWYKALVNFHWSINSGNKMARHFIVMDFLLRTSCQGSLFNAKPNMGCWWHSGNAHVRHDCDSGSIPTPCNYLIKVTLVTCEKSIIQFDSTKHRRFSLGTPASFCSNTRPVRGGPYWTSRENSLGSW